MEEILVKLLPPPAQEKPAPRAAAPAPPLPPKQVARETPREKTTRPERPAGKPAAKSTEAQVASGAGEAAPKPRYPTQEATTDKAIEAPEAPLPTGNPGVKENDTIVTAGLPTLKELLPPGFRVYPEGKEPPTFLDDRDPRQLSYQKKIEQLLQFTLNTKPIRGVEGRTVVEFVINKDGKIEQLTLLKSSGYSVLDQDSLNVIKEASPAFGALPKSIGRDRILFHAGFTYVNGVDAGRRNLDVKPFKGNLQGTFR